MRNDLESYAQQGKINKYEANYGREENIKKKHIHTKRQEEKKKSCSVCVGVCNTQKLDANDE